MLDLRTGAVVQRAPQVRGQALWRVAGGMMTTGTGTPAGIEVGVFPVGGAGAKVCAVQPPPPQEASVVCAYAFDRGGQSLRGTACTPGRSGHARCHRPATCTLPDYARSLSPSEHR